MNKTMGIILRLIPAVILFYSALLKFTAYPGSVQVFTALGMEPHGRIIIGVIELIAAACLVFPLTTAFGALLGFGTMLGATIAHVTQLGIVVGDDHGMLSLLALVVLVTTFSTLYRQRKKLPFLGKTL